MIGYKLLKKWPNGTLTGHTFTSTVYREGEKAFPAIGSDGKTFGPLVVSFDFMDLLRYVRANWEWPGYFYRHLNPDNPNLIEFWECEYEPSEEKSVWDEFLKNELSFLPYATLAKWVKLTRNVTGSVMSAIGTTSGLPAWGHCWDGGCRAVSKGE